MAGSWCWPRLAPRGSRSACACPSDGDCGFSVGPMRIAPDGGPCAEVDAGSMTATFPDTEVQPPDTAATEVLLLELREEVRRQGKSMRDTQRAFSIFALMAFLLATATLLAVAFKLDAKSK